MRLTALVFASLAIIISGCRDKSGVRGYWYSHTPDISDYASAEAEFTDFVEQAVQAPKADAFAAVDLLLRKAGEDGVIYRVYADLIARGFGTIASPCYSCEIFVHAADNILRKGILDGFSLEEYRLRREFCLHNRVGDVVEIPVLGDWDKAGFLSDRRTVFLVVDQDCPACRESMQRFSSARWDSAGRVALCYGRGPLPDDDGWMCLRLFPDQQIIDTRQAPFFFVTSPGGTVEITYTSVYEVQ